uniref:OAR domain-containing protein n=1 Tax=Anopheles dirus TaxID=7168 RepID=A0A182NGJ8_9DIPT
MTRRTSQEVPAPVKNGSSTLNTWSLVLPQAAFPGLCSCCPVKAPTTTGSSVSPTCSSASPSSAGSLSGSVVGAASAGLPSIASSVVSGGLPDPRSSSVAELRRKAQEHSAALLHSLQAAAAAGLAFPGFHLPPLTLHSALSGAGRKPSDFISDLSMHHHHHHHHLAAAAAAGAHHLGGHLASMHHSSNNNNNSTTANNNNTTATTTTNGSDSPSEGRPLALHTDSPRSPRSIASAGHEKSDPNE